MPRHGRPLWVMALVLFLLPGSPGYAQTLKMLFFGDMMVGRRIETLIDEYGVSHFFEGVRELPDDGNVPEISDLALPRSIGDFDLVGANLEGAVTEGGIHLPPVYPYDFAFPPERIAAIRDEGISYVTIANNHLFDQGKEGVQSTRSYLSELGIAFSGDVDSVVSDHSITLVEFPGASIGMVGLSEVYRPLDRALVSSILRGVDSRVDFTVVNIHWGVEYEYKPRQHQRDMAIVLVRSGADLIIGHHPHVPQGMEHVEGVPVFYSLGNFIFDQAFSADVQEGYAVAVSWRLTGDGGEIGVVKLLPYRAEGYVPRWLAGEEQQEILDRIASRSFGSPALLEHLRRGYLPVWKEIVRLGDR